MNKRTLRERFDDKWVGVPSQGAGCGLRLFQKPADTQKFRSHGQYGNAEIELRGSYTEVQSQKASTCSIFATRRVVSGPTIFILERLRITYVT